MIYKLGKLPKKEDRLRRTLQFCNYKADLAPPPPTCSWKAPVQWGMMANDQYGDCTMAGAGHMIESWTLNAQGLPVVIPDSQILSAYFSVTGGQDYGADLLTVLKYWRKHGIGRLLSRHRIDAFMELDAQNQDEMRQAIFLFGGAYIGVSLPDACVPQDGTEWTTIPWVGDMGKPNPYNGHCVYGWSYDARGVTIISWAAEMFMDWTFAAKYIDEKYAVLSRDWINLTSGMSASGLPLNTLEADLQAVTA